MYNAANFSTDVDIMRTQQPYIIIIIIILFVQKPKMKQYKLKTWTLNKTHQAQTSSYGGL